ncbi:MAG: hypothetical protein KIS86_14545 [Devosia sp.]|nr:hypothetical protein [Devosia sp.]
MPEFETDRPGLPVPLDVAAARPSLARSAPSAAFVSQLLAARDRLPPQRERRTASVERALGAYAQGSTIAQRRMPQGFRKMVMA